MPASSSLTDEESSGSANEQAHMTAAMTFVLYN